MSPADIFLFRRRFFEIEDFLIDSFNVFSDVSRGIETERFFESVKIMLDEVEKAIAELQDIENELYAEHCEEF